LKREKEKIIIVSGISIIFLCRKLIINLLNKMKKLKIFDKFCYQDLTKNVILFGVFLILISSKVQAQSSSFTASETTICSGLPVTFSGDNACTSITQSLNRGGVGNASSSLVSNKTDNFTVEQWVKYTPKPSVGNQLLFYNGNSGGNGFGIFVQSSGLLQVLIGGKGWGNANISLTPGIWQHLAVVRNSGTWYFYLNGIQYSTNYTTSPNTPNGGTFIGNNNSGGEIFDGKISQVAFWNAVRTTSQIQADMHACSSSGSDLAAYWSLNGTASDLSGNSHNLSLSNVTFNTDAPPVPPPGGAQYVFNFGDGSTYTSNVGSAIHTYTTASSYTVSLTVTYNGSSSTTTNSVLVNPTPLASISGPTDACGSASLTASGGTIYAWTSGSSLNTAATIISTTSTPSVTVSNTFGCSATASKSVIITPNTVSGTISANQAITSSTGSGTSLITVDQNLNGGGWISVNPDFYPYPEYDPYYFYPGSNEAQSFIASISALWTSLEINVQGINQPGDFTLDIYSGDGVYGNSLLSQTVNISNQGINSFTFSSPLSLTAGQFYTFKLSSNGSADIYIDYSGTTSPLGTFYQNGNSSGGALYFVNTYQINNANWNNLTLTGNTGDILYWKKSTNPDFSNATTIANTSATLYAGTIGNLSSTTYFRAVVQNGSCAVLNTDTVTVSVNTNTTTQVRALQCETTLAKLNTDILANNVVGASDYRFKVVANGATNVIERGFRRYFNLTMLPSGAVYNTAYTISVAVKKNNAWGDYGAECVVTTPALPATQVRAAQCNAMLASNGTDILADNLQFATAYRFKVVVNGTAYEVNPVGSRRYFKLTSLPIPVTAGTTYAVSVAAQFNGAWGTIAYGTECNVTTPGTADNSRQATSIETTDFSAVAYPNPSNSAFNLQVKGANNDAVSILVFDITGRQIENKVVKASAIENTTIGQNYSAGIYNVIVSQGVNSKTVRLVKN